MDWSVRFLDMRDIPILLDWYNNEKLHNIANAKPFKPYTIEQLTDYWQEKLSRLHASYYVIKIDDQLVGRVGLKKKVYKEGYSVEYSILIGESVHYSKGLGTKITRHFVTEAFLDPEVTAVNLAVREDNLRAIKCYEKAGFQVTGFFFENDVKMLEMRIDNR